MQEKLFAEKTALVEGVTFNYRIVNSDYAVITGYSPGDQYIRFNKSKDGYHAHVIKVPEEIDGVPVLVLSDIGLEIKMYGDDGYRHNGSSFIDLILPEYTVFNGFGCVKTNVGYFYPNYKVKYYSRKHCGLMFCENKGSVYCAKPLGENTCTILQISVGKSHGGCLEIPDAVFDRKVVAVADYSTYKLPKTIKSIKLSDGIRDVGRRCFRDLPELENVYLGKETRSIGDGCFYYYGEGNDESIVHAKAITVYYHQLPCCSVLSFVRKGELWVEEFNSKQGWVKIGEKRLDYEISFVPFDDCEFLTEGDVLVRCKSGLPYIQIPHGVKVISDGAFSQCTNTKKVILPYGVEEIGAYAFKDCKNLEDVVMPETLRTIGKGAFQNCEKLGSVYFPDSVEIIESHLCHGCVCLKNVKLPQNLKLISEYSFSGCPMETIEFPQGVECIKHFAFAGCKNLKRVILAEPIENVDIYAFDNTAVEAKI